MMNPDKIKWQLKAVAVIIFVLGFVAGALGLSAYRAWSRGRSANPQNRFEQMSERLKLNSDQKVQVQQILGDTREQLQSLRKQSEPKVNEIRQQADERLQKVLTPDQWQQFQQMRNDMRGRGGRDRERNDGGSLAPAGP